MKFKLTDKLEQDSRLLKDAFNKTLDTLMAQDETVCYLDADLMSCVGTGGLAAKYPGRAINCGIAESNMIGVAAGMAAVGLKPYVHTFGPFASRRVADQVFMSLAYAKLGARIVGSDPGVTAAFNGGTHMPFEDMAMMLSIPNMVVLEPCDYDSAVDVFKKVKDYTTTPVFIRLPRKNAVKVYESVDLEIGKGIIVKDGSDVTIISSGILVAEALKAAAQLAKDGISARVVDLFTWKPIDKELIAKCAKETGAIVTAENHNTLCGLGAQVANVLAETVPAPIEKVGVHDCFGQVGPENFLREEYKLTSAEIIENVKKVLSRK